MSMTTIAQSCELHARIGWQGLTKKEYLEDGDYYLVTGVDFNNGHIAFDRCHFVTKDRYDQDQHIQLKVDDVLVTKDGTIGKVAIIDKPIDKPATLNSGVFVVRPKNPQKLLPHYLMLALSSGHFNRFIERIKVGCTIAHLNQEKFLDFEFPLPTIKEQECAIKVFDVANSLLAKRRQQLQKLDDLIKARFIEMFVQDQPMWSEVTVEDLCTNMRTGPFGSALHHDEFVGSGVFVLGIDNAVENKFSYNKMRYITKDKYQQLKRYTVYPGDVIITIMGTIGRSAVIPDDIPLAINTKHLACLTPNLSKINSVFLCAAFQMHPAIRHQLLGNTKGAIMEGLNLTIIKGLKLRLPPLSLQKDFVAFSSQITKTKSIVQRSLAQAQTLFAALMQEHFG